MSTPPTMSSPTAPAPPPPPPGSSKRGCWIALIVVVLLGLAGCTSACLLLKNNGGRFTAWEMGIARGKAIAAIASDVPDEQKAQFTKDFDAYLQCLRDHNSDFAAKAQDLTAPAQQIGQAMMDKRITAEEIERF